MIASPPHEDASVRAVVNEAAEFATNDPEPEPGNGGGPTELITAHVLAPKCLKPIVKASHFLSGEGGHSDLLTWWARKGVGLVF